VHLRARNKFSQTYSSSKKKLGEYVFFVDIDGYVFSPSLQEALWALKDKGVSTKLLGSYPKAQPFAKE